MPGYCGVDFHARQQTISYCETADGEIHQIELEHKKEGVRSFYSQFKGDVIVGSVAGIVSLIMISL